MAHSQAVWQGWRYTSDPEWLVRRSWGSAPPVSFMFLCNADGESIGVVLAT